MFPRPNFFEGSTLNFAYNLLYPSTAPNPTSTAIISVTETTTKEISWQELRQEVVCLATAMRAHGLKPYDRVAGFLGNHHNTVIAMLAATWLGAIWTGISADQGVGAVLDRLVQIKPFMLFADNAVEHSGKIHESATKTKEIIKSLPTLKAAVVFETVPGVVDITGYDVAQGKAWSYADFLSRYASFILPNSINY
jgi:acetoacetyl-CoA synthetase